MAAITFAARLTDDGSLTIPQEAVESLQLHPGDEITVRIETGGGDLNTEQATQDELLKRISKLFEDADAVVREPAKPLTDPYEAAWAAGVEEKARRMGIKF